MGLLDQGKAIIRVAPNELQPKSLNPNVPYGPQETAADVIACAHAGATIAHVHSRHDDGRQAFDDDSAGAGIYRRILELVARESDILVEPTNCRRGEDPTTSADVPHLWALVDQPPPGARLEIVNIDGFRLGSAAWDQATGTLYSLRKHYEGRSTQPYPGPAVVQEALRRGLIPFFGLFDLKDTRMLAAMAHQGVVSQPVLVQINFFCDQVTGATPSIEALDAILHEWRQFEIDAELCLFVRMAPDLDFYERLLNAALERGVHPRVGLGDNPHLFSTNVAMVEHAADLAGGHGFTLATPADLRRRVGLAIPAETAS